MSDILGDLADEIVDAEPDDDASDDVGDGGGVYDPTTEFAGENVTLSMPDPVERDLSAEEWGIVGEGPPSLWDEFVDALNDGRIDDVPVEITPDAPDWGDPLAFAKSAQKPRGKTLAAHVGMTPESMMRVQGEIGAGIYGDTSPSEFMSRHRSDDVDDYAQRFEAGDRPRPFVVEVDKNGELTNHQEGRHRALAAEEAGLDVVHVIVLWETGGTFIRRDRRRGPDDPGYREHYPEEK